MVRRRHRLRSRADGVEVYDGGLLACQEVGQFGVRGQGGEFGHEARGDAEFRAFHWADVKPELLSSYSNAHTTPLNLYRSTLAISVGGVGGR